MGIFNKKKYGNSGRDSRETNPLLNKSWKPQGIGYGKIALPPKGTGVPGVPYKIGDHIGGQYDVLLICGGPGKSGMGVVYIVRSITTGEIFALKTHQDRYLDSPDTLELFKNEAHIWIGLGRHQNIVWASWVGEIEDKVYIAVEYVPPDWKGRNTLTHYSADKDSMRLLKWAIQFCHGIEYAYSRGLRAHLDIKPDNIMITPGGDVKITDFGLARSYQGIFVEGRTMPCGTPYYMPPEQFVSITDAGPKNDIYSYGVVLFQMATGGQLPFVAQARNSAELLKKMQRLHESEQVPKIDSELYPVIAKCMEKSPEKRFASFKEVRLELENLFERKGGKKFKPPSQIAISAENNYNTGYSYATLGDDEKALEFYNKALEELSDDWKVWHEKAIIFAKSGRHDEALRHYEKAIQLDPDEAIPLWNKAITYIELKRFEEALDVLQRFVEKARGKDELKKNVELAERALSGRNYQQVRDEVDRFLKNKGYNGFPAIATSIEKAVSEGRVRVGPLKTMYYTIIEGNWLIAEDVAKDRKEMTKSLTWLACSEMGVPGELRDRLLAEMDNDLEDFLHR